jgi:hypothetical protein
MTARIKQDPGPGYPTVIAGPNWISASGKVVGTLEGCERGVGPDAGEIGMPVSGAGDLRACFGSCRGSNGALRRKRRDRQKGNSAGFDQAAEWDGLFLSERLYSERDLKWPPVPTCSCRRCVGRGCQRHPSKAPLAAYRRIPSMLCQ